MKNQAQAQYIVVFVEYPEETPFEEMLEELLYEAIIDKMRAKLYYYIELPVDGFGSHTEWWKFCDKIVKYVTDALEFFVRHGTELPDVTDEKIFEVINILKDIASTIINIMDSDNGWFDPFSDQSLDIFERNMDSKVNNLR